LRRRYSSDLATTALNFLRNKDVFRANIAQQLDVTTAQVSVLAWGASTQEGMLSVQVSVLPQSEVDIITSANVDAALAAANLTAGEELGGDAAVANVVLAGAPDTKIIVTSRPGGRTVPITEDGRLPGSLMDVPETSNQARFRWGGAR
jgi:hypothetical protein